jgi:hypothetical protein
MFDHLGEFAVRKRHAHLGKVLHHAKLWEDRRPGPGGGLSGFNHEKKASKFLAYRTTVLVTFIVRYIYPVPSTARPKVSQMSDDNVTATHTGLFRPALKVRGAWLCSSLSSHNPPQSFGQ